MKIDIDLELSGMIRSAAIVQGVNPEEVVEVIVRENIENYLLSLQTGARSPVTSKTTEVLGELDHEAAKLVAKRSKPTDPKGTEVKRRMPEAAWPVRYGKEKNRPSDSDELSEKLNELGNSISESTREMAVWWFATRLGKDVDTKEAAGINRRFNAFIENLSDDFNRLNLADEVFDLPEEKRREWYQQLRQVNQRLRELAITSRGREWTAEEAKATLKELNELRAANQEAIKKSTGIDPWDCEFDAPTSEFMERMDRASSFVTDEGEMGFIGDQIKNVKTIDNALDCVAQLINVMEKADDDRPYRAVLTVMDLLTDRLNERGKIKGTDGAYFVQVYSDIKEACQESIQLREDMKHEEGQRDFLGLGEGEQDHLEKMQWMGEQLQMMRERLGTRLTNLQLLVEALKEQEGHKVVGTKELLETINDRGMTLGKKTAQTLSPIFKDLGTVPKKQKGWLKTTFLNLDDYPCPLEETTGFVFDYEKGSGGYGAEVGLNPVFSKVPKEVMVPRYIHALRSFFALGDVSDKAKSAFEGKDESLLDYVSVDEIQLRGFMSERDFPTISKGFSDYSKKLEDEGFAQFLMQEYDQHTNLRAFRGPLAEKGKSYPDEATCKPFKKTVIRILRQKDAPSIIDEKWFSEMEWQCARKAIDPRDPKFKPMIQYDEDDLLAVESA